MKNYSIYSFLSFIFGLIGSFLFFMICTPVGKIFYLEIDETDFFPLITIFAIVPLLILLTIFFGKLSIRDGKKRGLKGRILAIIGIALVILPLLYYVFFILAALIFPIK